MIRSLRIVLFLCSLGTVGVQSAVAEKAPTTLNQEALDSAERAFFKGLTHYRNGRYGEAITGFQAAYTVTTNRAMLYNIARCHERMGDAQSAVEWYRAYLKTRPTDTTAVLGRVEVLVPDDDGLRRKLRQRMKGNRTAAPPPPVSLQPLGYRWFKWGLIGVGGASVSVAVALGLRSLDAADRSRSADDPVATAQWSDQAEHDALLADVFGGVGLVAAGIATYLIISEAMGEPPKVIVAPETGGASVQYHLEF